MTGRKSTPLEELGGMLNHLTNTQTTCHFASLERRFPDLGSAEGLSPVEPSARYAARKSHSTTNKTYKQKWSAERGNCYLEYTPKRSKVQSKHTPQEKCVHVKHDCGVVPGFDWKCVLHQKNAQVSRSLRASHSHTHTAFLCSFKLYYSKSVIHACAD